MIAFAHVDFETRSAADLKVVGLFNYVNDPTTDVWCMAWAIGDMEPEIWRPGMPAPAPLMAHVRAGGTVVAHNAPFELAVWNTICTRDYFFAPLAPAQTECTMAMGYAMGLPGALEDAALALGLRMLKDADGRALMLRMARPRSKAGVTPIVWWDEPEKLVRLEEYCRQDVRVERALHERLMPLGVTERRVWLADYAINQRGIQLDVETVRGALATVDKLKEEANVTMTAVTGGAVSSIGSLAALKEWCGAQGHPIESLAKGELPDIIDALPDGPVKDALTLRQETGKASLAKLDVMMDVAAPDGRLRNLYQYYGAGTGRWAGRKVQPHNMTRDVPENPADVDCILRWMRDGRADSVEMVYGPPLTQLSRCLRPLFIAKPGHVLVGGDWSNVEGRGVAWFCGEDWKTEAFRSGQDLYKLAYSKSFGVPVESVSKGQRQVGKVMELAFGYAGGKGAFHTMGKAFGLKVPDAEAELFKRNWRKAHPNVVRTWKELNDAAMNAVRAPGTAFTAGYPGRHVTFKVVGSFLWCLLPSGRALCYPYPKLLDGEYGQQLTYMSQPSPDDIRKGRVIYDPQNSATWARLKTYGGSLLENIVQAFCRDFLADLILWAEARGDNVVVHTHDDCFGEVPESRAAECKAAWTAKMNNPPAWAAGFPLHADVEVTRRYGT